MTPLLGSIDIEHELRISHDLMRERCNVTAHEQVLPFQRRRQICGHAPCCAEQRPAQPSNESCNEAREQSRPWLESTDERKRERRDEQTDGPMPAGQTRQAMNDAVPEQKCERNSPHPDLPV